MPYKFALNADKWGILRRLAGWLCGCGSADQAALRKNRSMDKEHTFEGHFWLPGREANRQAGVLRVGPGLAPTIATIEPLLSPWREVRRTDQPDGQTTVVTQDFVVEELTTPVTIHGLDGHRRPLTLISATTVHWGRPDAAGYTHQFRGIQAVVGGYMRDRDHSFTGFRVRLRNLEAWRPRLQQAQWTAEVSLANGGSITIEDLPVPGQASHSALWLTGRALPPATLRGMGTYFVRPLISLFTLATGRPCPLLALQVQEDSPGGPWWDVYSAALQAEESTDLRWDMPRWLLRPADVGLPQVGTWLDKVSLLGPLPAVVADLAQAHAISLDTQALLLATVAEGLHRRLYPDDLRFHEDRKLNKDIAERVQVTAAEAVDLIHPDAKIAVSSLLKHVGDIGYAKRLARLASVAEAAAPGVTGRTSRWRNLVFKVRNEYAHRISAGFLNDRDVDDRMTVAFSLRWLLTTVLLLQGGVDASVLRTRLTTHEQYQRFLIDAQVWCPQIYR